MFHLINWESYCHNKFLRVELRPENRPLREIGLTNPRFFLCTMDPQPNGYKNLSSKLLSKVISHLLGSMENGVLPRGKLLEVSLIYGVHRATISRLWARATVSRATLLANSPELISLRFGQEHNLKYPSEELRPAVLEIPGTRTGSVAVCREKSAFIRPHTNNVKPPLTKQNDNNQPVDRRRQPPPPLQQRQQQQQQQGRNVGNTNNSKAATAATPRTARVQRQGAETETTTTINQ
jgi:hypothetical protein